MDSRSGILEKAAQDIMLSGVHPELLRKLYDIWAKNNYVNPIKVQRENVNDDQDVDYSKEQINRLSEIIDAGYIPAFHPTIHLMKSQSIYVIS